jgi:crossover junction endodeoxyribonuclease RuvC
MAVSSSWRVLGVDPGTLRLGFGVVEARGATLELVESGVFTVPASRSVAARLGALGKEVEALVERTRPDELALEASFFGLNAQSLVRLGEARGCVLAIAGARGIFVSDHPPATVKRAVTGHGNASKEQVARVLAATFPRLGDSGAIAQLDQTDAIAVAVCASHARRTRATLAAVEALARAQSSRPRGA